MENSFLSGQNPQQIQQIINAENARIDAKQQSYQNMQFGQQRILQLNQNYQERTTFFNHILLVLFLTIVFTVILIFLNRNYSGFETLISIALVLVISIGLCYAIYLYLVFINRNPMNFDEIQYGASITPSPVPNNTGINIQGNVMGDMGDMSGNMSGNIPGSCIGPLCCNGIDVIWDAGNNVCTSNMNLNTTTGNIFGNISPWMETSSLSMNPANVPSIPKLTTGQLFLGPRGRNVIQVEDSKTFILTILHVKNIVYTSLDGIHFVNTADGSDTASVVTSGPVGPMGQKVNGQAIVIHRPDGNRFFYSSKHPPLLLKGDIFLSDSQVMIEVLSSNEFTLKTDSTSDVLRKYSSVNGHRFKEYRQRNPNDTDEISKAYVVVHGPISAVGDNMLGQGIKLREDGKDIYFYYSRNISESTDNNNINLLTPTPTAATSTSVDIPASVATLTSSSGSKSGFTTIQEDIPSVYINQYKVYPTLKNKKQQKNGYQPIQEDLPYSEYSTSTNLFPF